MASELERFRAALNAQRIESRNGYCHFGHIDAALDQATHPSGSPSAKFPKMIYRDNQNRIVTGVDELSQALAEGWSETAPPPFEAGFPKWYCERPTSMGGRKTVGNLRRVQINDSEQERQFFAVVDSDEWMGDSVTSLWGAQGVSPETLTREHKEDLKDLVDRDLLEIVETPADDDAVASGADPTVAPE